MSEETEEGWKPNAHFSSMTEEQRQALETNKKSLKIHEVFRWFGWAFMLFGFWYLTVDRLIGPLIILVGIVIALDRGKKCAFLRKRINNPTGM